MADRNMSRDPLEAFFAASRKAAPQPSEALIARIVADAGAEFAARQTTFSRPSPRAGLGQMLLGVLGGWRAVGGLATATMAGLWIGFAGADRLGDVASGYLGGAGVEVLGTVDLLPGEEVFAWAMGEEG